MLLKGESSPPVLQIAAPTVQDLQVYHGTTDLGSILTIDHVTQLLGLTNTEFTIHGGTAADGVAGDQLPADGTVYDVFNLGGGYENVYIAVPGEDGAKSITDVFMTPFGNLPIMTDFDATVPLNPATALDALDAPATDAAAGADPPAFLGL